MSLILLLHNPQLHILIIQFPVLLSQVHALNWLQIGPVSSLLYLFVIEFAVFEWGVKLDLSHLLILYWKIIIL